MPSRRDLTPRLLVGSALFGVGWGLSGICPGPAITSTVSGNLAVLVFFATMVVGMVLFRVYESARLGATLGRSGSLASTVGRSS